MGRLLVQYATAMRRTQRMSFFLSPFLTRVRPILVMEIEAIVQINPLKQIIMKQMLTLLAVASRYSQICLQPINDHAQ